MQDNTSELKLLLPQMAHSMITRFPKTPLRHAAIKGFFESLCSVMVEVLLKIPLVLK